jgi:hypothetical protein
MKDIIKQVNRFRYNKLCILSSILSLSFGCNIGLSYKLYKQPKLATIDVDYFVKDAVKKAAHEDNSKEAIKEELIKLDSYLAALCAKENLIVLPSKAVIGGGIDITEQIIKVMADEKR